MVHKRSQEAFVHRIRVATAFRDRELAETVCTVTRKELIAAVKAEYGDVKRDVPGPIERADVLTDSRGRGVLQQIPSAKEVNACQSVRSFSSCRAGIA